MAKSKVVPDTKETKTNSVIDVTEVQKDAKQDAAIENKRVAMIKEKEQAEKAEKKKAEKAAAAKQAEADKKAAAEAEAKKEKQTEELLTRAEAMIRFGQNASISEIETEEGTLCRDGTIKDAKVLSLRGVYVPKK